MNAIDEFGRILVYNMNIYSNIYSKHELDDDKALSDAWDPYTPAVILAKLSTSHLGRVRAGVAWNPNTSAETLLLMVHDPSWYVRSSIAEHKNTSAEALVFLAEDEDTSVRCRVMENPNTPELVKFWLRNSGFAGLTLKEFLSSMT